MSDDDTKSVQRIVRDDLFAREQLGRQRYGTSLYPFNGRHALVDAYQEALDLAVYLRQFLIELGITTITDQPEPLPPQHAICRQRTDDEAAHLSDDFFCDDPGMEPL